MRKAPEEFMGWIRSEMLKRKLSIRETAKLAGVSHPTISELITLEKQPTFELCAKLAKAFGYDEIFVLGLAGLIPKQGDNKEVELANFLFLQLPEDDRQEIIELIQIKLKRKKKTNAQTDNGTSLETT
jgi:transcriptional regulator with XRE-family HTH domain